MHRPVLVAVGTNLRNLFPNLKIKYDPFIIWENLRSILVSVKYFYQCWHSNNIIIIYFLGHFTQVVWKDSKKLGVGIAVSSSGGVYVVARYSPPGNVMNQFAENVLSYE